LRGWAANDPTTAFATGLSFARQLKADGAGEDGLTPLLGACDDIIEAAQPGTFDTMTRRLELMELVLGSEDELRAQVAAQEVLDEQPESEAAAVTSSQKKRWLKKWGPAVAVGVLGLVATAAVGHIVERAGDLGGCSDSEAERPNADPSQVSQEYRAAQDWLETSLGDTTTLDLDSHQLTCRDNRGEHLTDEVVEDTKEVARQRPSSRDDRLILEIPADGSSLNALLESGVGKGVELPTTTSTTVAGL
jgi:hypothetical protein